MAKSKWQSLYYLFVFLFIIFYLWVILGYWFRICGFVRLFSMFLCVSCALNKFAYHTERMVKCLLLLLYIFCGERGFPAISFGFIFYVNAKKYNKFLNRSFSILCVYGIWWYFLFENGEDYWSLKFKKNWNLKMNTKDFLNIF